ncbi:hypothetical protein [Arthrobacter sp. UYEF3]|uniref:hypothetical protein n=1 Tax=Arthrobacter sp. UYEF3 TaxID=1756365 RepID=UPI003393D0A5
MALPHPAGTPQPALAPNPLASCTAKALHASGGMAVSRGNINEVLGATLMRPSRKDWHTGATRKRLLTAYAN